MTGTKSETAPRPKRARTPKPDPAEVEAYLEGLIQDPIAVQINLTFATLPLSFMGHGIGQVTASDPNPATIRTASPKARRSLVSKLVRNGTSCLPTQCRGGHPVYSGVPPDRVIMARWGPLNRAGPASTAQGKPASGSRTSKRTLARRAG